VKQVEAAAAIAVVGPDVWAAANHRQVPLKKHSFGYNSIWYDCCKCTDKSSTYCCTPSSPTNFWIKDGYTYKGTGDQTSKSSYTSAKQVEAAAAAVDGSDGWAAANHRQVPLKKHDQGWSNYGPGDRWYNCCCCTDKSSTYCCSPSSPTHDYIKDGYTYNGTGDQTKSSNYSSAKETAEETARKVKKAESASAIAVVGPDVWAAANHRQVPLKEHDDSWTGSHYPCCLCHDKSSTYCCSPSSPTHSYIKNWGMTYNGTGDQTDSSSYTKR
jgi:hypothetical protein